VLVNGVPVIKNGEHTGAKAGRGYCGDYRFLGLLPVPVEHVSDIMRL